MPQGDDSPSQAAAAPDAMRALIQGIEALPSAPASAGRILTLAARAQPDFNELVEALEADQAVSLKLLRYANSAENNLAGKVEDIRKAAMLLGLDTVCAVALCVSVRDGLFGSLDASDPLVRGFWRHSLACACAAALLARTMSPQNTGAAFAAGLVHDGGKLALLAVKGQEYAGLMQDDTLRAQDLLALEQERFGVDHCLAGKWLFERWKLPERLVEAAWMHHQPAAALLGSRKPGSLALMTCLADRLAHEVCGTTPLTTLEGDRGGLAQALGLDGDALRSVQAGVGAEFAAKAALFDISEDAGHFYFNALNRANRRLGQTALNLTDKSRSLERDARCLRWVAMAAVDMAKAADAQEVLAAVARCLEERLGAPGGLACLVDPMLQVCRGQAWGFGGPARPVSLRLDADLTPLRETLSGLPHDFAANLSGCRIRATALAGPDGPPVHLSGGVVTVSLRPGDENFGELIFLAPGKTVSPEERGAVSLLAELASQSLRHLEMVTRCERRSESLAQVMGAMQEMNEKLLKTQRLAAVGQLAAGAAHEINNPLAIISARAQLLEMREEDAAKKKGLRQMIEQIDRISAILGSLMDFARPAAPRMEAVSPREVMERVLSLVEGSLRAKRVHIERVYEGGVPDIKADPRQLEQVLLNLALNAQHAMEEAGGTLTVRLNYLPGPDAVVFSVADTGVGISKELQEKIFDPFFTTKAEGKGTGLGLSTAYGIVTAHKGRIEVRSEPGQGALFTVELPRDAQAPEGGETALPGDRPSRQAVLVVDDERNIRDILREALESKGYAAEVAEDGDKALELLKKNRYQLMILDIRMPSRDGLGLLKQAKSFADPSMPVLVLTGLASEAEVQEAKALGAAACLRKPFQVEVLMAQAGELLAAKQ